jgi:hypothetical protein
MQRNRQADLAGAAVIFGRSFDAAPSTAMTSCQAKLVEMKHMLTLDLPAEPYWLDLPRRVRVEIRPVTTAVMAAAQAAAARRLAAIRIADPDLDPDMSRGLSFAFLVKALARHAVTAWEGIGDAAGKPLPLSPEAVERLMDLDDIAAAFWDRATAPIAAVAAEGNG